VIPAPGFDETQLLQVVASLEKASEYPLAAAILAEAKEKKIELLAVTEFNSVTGKGVAGQVQSKRVGIGNAALMADLGASANEFQDKQMHYRKRGKQSCLSHRRASSPASLQSPIR
jgi:P-type Cu+ transporter